MKIGDTVKISRKCPVKAYRGKIGTIAGFNKSARNLEITHCYISIPNFNSRPKITVRNLEFSEPFDGTFRVGDVVKIVMGSRFDRGSLSNPSDTEGTITDIIETNGILPIKIQWSVGITNAYAHYDLEFIRRS